MVKQFKVGYDIVCSNMFDLSASQDGAGEANMDAKATFDSGVEVEGYLYGFYHWDVNYPDKNEHDVGHQGSIDQILTSSKYR